MDRGRASVPGASRRSETGSLPQLPGMEIALLGSERVGKSCLANQFQFGAFLDAYIPTLPEDFNWVEFEADEGSIMIKIIDLSGSREFIAQRKLYMSSCDAFLVVFSLDSRESWEEAKEIWAAIRATNPKGPPVKVVGTKEDLFGEESEWAVGRAELEGWVAERRAGLATVSAKDTDAVCGLFRELLAAARKVGTGEQLRMRRQSSPAIIRSARGSISQLSKAEVRRLQKAAAAAAAQDMADDDEHTPNLLSKARRYFSQVFHHGHH